MYVCMYVDIYSIHSIFYVGAFNKDATASVSVFNTEANEKEARKQKRDAAFCNYSH